MTAGTTAARAVPVEVLTDEELAILAGPGGLVVTPYLDGQDEADPVTGDAVRRTAYRGLVARGILEPPTPAALAAAVGEATVELQVREDVLSLVALRRAAQAVVAVARTTAVTQDFWYAHVVDDVVVLEQVGHDGLHRFALASATELADLVVDAAVHPECGDGSGPALALDGDGSEPPLEVVEALGSALLRSDVVIRRAEDDSPPLHGLFTGPDGAWVLTADRDADAPVTARPAPRAEVEAMLRAAVTAAVGVAPASAQGDAR
ncbi:hypothetical protein AB6N23_07900 [Cellulomonas sp. 179-A 9B4 NHS]|uniref:hypothetical protein n=1 Tax=Cellulomonas sp. 179-A 9B4 NHS TaxID=3142379 RepID=UPI0039A13DAA